MRGGGNEHGVITSPGISTATMYFIVAYHEIFIMAFGIQQICYTMKQNAKCTITCNALFHRQEFCLRFLRTKVRIITVSMTAHHNNTRNICYGLIPFINMLSYEKHEQKYQLNKTPRNHHDKKETNCFLSAQSTDWHRFMLHILRYLLHLLYHLEHISIHEFCIRIWKLECI